MSNSNAASDYPESFAETALRLAQRPFPCQDGSDIGRLLEDLESASPADFGMLNMTDAKHLAHVAKVARSLAGTMRPPRK